MQRRGGSGGTEVLAAPCSAAPQLRLCVACCQAPRRLLPLPTLQAPLTSRQSAGTLTFGGPRRTTPLTSGSQPVSVSGAGRSWYQLGGSCAHQRRAAARAVPTLPLPVQSCLPCTRVHQLHGARRVVGHLLFHLWRPLHRQLAGPGLDAGRGRAGQASCLAALGARAVVDGCRWVQMQGFGRRQGVRGGAAAVAGAAEG